MKEYVLVRLLLAAGLTLLPLSLGFSETKSNTPSDSSYFVGEGEIASLSLERVHGEVAIYVTKKSTGEPFSQAKVYVQEGKEGSEPLEAKSIENGIYKLSVAKGDFTPSQVNVQTNDESDIIDLTIPSYKKLNETAASKSSSIGIGQALLVALATSIIWILMIAIFYTMRRRRMPQASELMLAAILVSYPTHCAKQAYAHGGHDHGGGEENKSSAEDSASGGDIVMSKKSQFLIGLRTVVAKSEDSTGVMKSFGHIIPPPQNDALIVAPQAGYLKGTQNLTLGKKVKRGETLGFLQTVNQISLASPIDGVLAEMFAFNGARVEGGGKIFRVINPETLWVDAELFANQMSKLSQVGRAFIAVEGFKEDIEAKILNAATPISEETRTAKVYLELVSPPPSLKVGTFVDISFELKPEKNEKTISVPKSAVLSRAGEPIVFVQTGAETFSIRPVALEESSRPGTVLIHQGINEGERIVVVGSYQLLMKAK